MARVMSNHGRQQRWHRLPNCHAKYIWPHWWPYEGVRCLQSSSVIIMDMWAHWLERLVLFQINAKKENSVTTSTYLWKGLHPEVHCKNARAFKYGKYTLHTNVRHVCMFMLAEQNLVMCSVDDDEHTQRSREQDYGQHLFFIKAAAVNLYTRIPTF